MGSGKIRSWFSFTRGERNGVFLLVTLIAAVLLASYILDLVPADWKDYPALEEKLDTFLRQVQSGNPGSLPPKEGLPAVYDTLALFRFDPNTATPEELGKLGFSPDQAGALVNYRQKGGRFYRRSDLKKIYGLHGEQYLILEPYIEIRGTGTKIGPEGGKPSVDIEINSSDSSVFEELDGIGPVLAGRIVRYRELLGGYFSVSQLSEVYGLGTGIIEKYRACLRTDSTLIRKININTCEFGELLRHPYLEYPQVKLIFGRRQKGPFLSPEALYLEGILSKEEFDRIRPYLET